MSNKKKLQKHKGQQKAKKPEDMKSRLIASFNQFKGKINVDKLKQHRKKIAVASCATVIAATSLFLLPDNSISEQGNLLANSIIENNLNDVFFKGTYIGTIKDTDSVDVALNAVLQRMNTEDKQVYALPEDLKVEEASVEPRIKLRDSEFETALYDRLQLDKNQLLVQAYVVEVENGTTVTLESIEQVKSAITNVTKQYLPEEAKYEVAKIDVNSEEDNSIEIKKEEEIALALADVDKKNPRMSTLAKSSEAPEAQLAGVSVAASTAVKDGVTNVTLEDKVKVKTNFVPQKDIQSVDQAVEKLTDFETEQVIYKVQPGDYPGKIAEEHNMGLSELYALNPDVQEKSTSIQIGQELTITQPDPNLSVKTQEISTYDESFNTEPVIEYDDSQYTTYSRVKKDAVPGTRRITAEISKINGKQINKEVINEAVVKEPEAKVIVKGTLTPPQFINPVPGGRLTSGYGYRWGSMHRAIDLAAPYGTPIKASASGRVEYAGWMNGYGYLVIINHGNGYKTYYGHNSSLKSYVGKYVNQGDTIALMGSTGNSTGNHCHFEIRYYGEFKNPANYIY